VALLKPAAGIRGFRCGFSVGLSELVRMPAAVDGGTIRRENEEVVGVNDSPRHVVVAGAGVAGLETALALQALAQEFVSVEVVAPEQEFTYRPLAVAEPFRMGQVRRFPLEPLVRAAGAELRPGALAAVDPEGKAVTLADGDELDYDVLVLALGARPCEAISGALTFRGPEDGVALARLLDRTTDGELRRIVFAVPAASSWPLPLYELAFLTAEYLLEHLTRGVEIVLATPEDRPLGLFGSAASEAVARLLDARGIGLETATVARSWEDGVLRLAGGATLAADAVVALPRLEGQRIPGLPQDRSGFVPTDDLGWVLGLTDVYAAGDLTQFPLKQGGTATQQADAAASSIAADAGAAVKPEPFRPVLRGLLLTGFVPRYLRAEATGAHSVVDTEPLWWPPAKIVGRYLTPFLAAKLGLAETVVGPLHKGAIPIEVELETGGRPAWSRV
jgi:sulfide:quinone oxidoreductase